MKAKVIFEAIKHLSPKSQKEVDDSFYDIAEEVAKKLVFISVEFNDFLEAVEYVLSHKNIVMNILEDLDGDPERVARFLLYGYQDSGYDYDIDESIKHLSPKSQKEIDDSFYDTAEEVAQKLLLISVEFNDFLEAVEFVLSHKKWVMNLIERSSVDAENIANHLLYGWEYPDHFEELDDEIDESIKHLSPRSEEKIELDESIKHLAPRSKEDIKLALKNLSPEEKVKEGNNKDLVWLIKQGIEEGANIIESLLQLRNYSWKDERKDIINSLLGRKDKIRETIKHRNVYERMQVAKLLDIQWLKDEILKNEEGELNAYKFYKHIENAENSPIQFLKNLKMAFNPLKERFINVSYKVVSDGRFVITMKEKVFLSDEIEDRSGKVYQPEEDEPIIFKVTLAIYPKSKKGQYYFSIEDKPDERGHGTWNYEIELWPVGGPGPRPSDYSSSLNRILDIEYGFQTNEFLDTLIDEIVFDEYEKFRTKYLDELVDKVEISGNEQYDDEKYYPELQEGIKHLKPKSQKEIETLLSNASIEELEEMFSHRFGNHTLNKSFLNKNVLMFDTYWDIYPFHYSEEIERALQLDGIIDVECSVYVYLETNKLSYQIKAYNNDYGEWIYEESDTKKLDLEKLTWAGKILYIQENINHILTQLKRDHALDIVERLIDKIDVGDENEHYDDEKYYPELQKP